MFNARTAGIVLAITFLMSNTVGAGERPPGRIRPGVRPAGHRRSGRLERQLQRLYELLADVRLELVSARKSLPHRPAGRRTGHRPEQGRHRRGAGHPRPRPRRGLSRAPGSGSDPDELEDPDDEVVEQGARPRRRPRLGQAVKPPGREAAGQGPGAGRRPGPLGSHQAKAADYRELIAFALADGDRRLFAVVSENAGDRQRFRELLADLRTIIGRYDLHRGWFGTGTLLHSVTCHPGHPLEVIGQGLGQGNDWFTFSGYMDYLMRSSSRSGWSKVGLDIAVDVGTGKATHSLGTVAYGLRDYDGLKIQDMPTEEEWIRFVKDRGGYIFRPVYAPDCDKYHYDGQIAIDGNKKQIDTEDVPFILQTGLIKEEAPAAMVLFAEKGRRLSRREMWIGHPGRGGPWVSCPWAE